MFENTPACKLLYFLEGWLKIMEIYNDGLCNFCTAQLKLKYVQNFFLFIYG